MVTEILAAVVGGVSGSILIWYLQRRFTPDPASEVLKLRNEFAEFKQQVEIADKKRSEFENFPFSIALSQGTHPNYILDLTNDSKYRVSVETIQILRGDADNESPLTKPAKPGPNDDWSIEAGQRRELRWHSQDDPASILRLQAQNPEPNFPTGRVIPVTFALSLNVEGKRLLKKRTQEVCFQGQSMIPWGP